MWEQTQWKFAFFLLLLKKILNMSSLLNPFFFIIKMKLFEHFFWLIVINLFRGCFLGLYCLYGIVINEKWIIKEKTKFTFPSSL